MANGTSQVIHSLTHNFLHTYAQNSITLHVKTILH